MNANDNKYNGWNTYETWLVNLWIGNDAGSSARWNECADEALERLGETDAVRHLADLLREFHEDMLPDETGLAADLMRAALQQVDWEEIASALLEAAKESV